MEMDLQEAKIIIKGFASYLYNTSMHEIVMSIFPNAHESYIQEKTRLIKERGIATFLGYLDQDNFNKFCGIVMDYISKHEIV